MFERDRALHAASVRDASLLIILIILITNASCSRKKTHKASNDCPNPVPSITTSHSVSLKDSISEENSTSGSFKSLNYGKQGHYFSLVINRVRLNQEAKVLKALKFLASSLGSLFCFFIRSMINVATLLVYLQWEACLRGLSLGFFCWTGEESPPCIYCSGIFDLKDAVRNGWYKYLLVLLIVGTKVAGSLMLSERQI